MVSPADFGSKVWVVSGESVQLGQKYKEKINRKRNTIRLMEFEEKDWRGNRLISPKIFGFSKIINNKIQILFYGIEGACIRI